MKSLMIKDLSCNEALHRAPMGAVRGGFCGTPPGPIVTLPPIPAIPPLPAMPPFPGIPAIPAVPALPPLPGQPVPL